MTWYEAITTGIRRRLFQGDDVMIHLFRIIFLIILSLSIIHELPKVLP